MKPESMIYVVVGDRSKVEPGIREMKLGDLRILDVNGNPLQ
jgi:zinc protease